MSNIFPTGIPIDYPHINMASSFVDPSPLHVRDSMIAGFFRRHLFEKMLSVYDWTFPDTWLKSRAENYFLYTLYVCGYISVVDSIAGPVPQHCSIKGRNKFYQPAQILIENPYFKEVDGEYTIGTNTELIQITPDYFGIYDIINVYASRMALADRTAGVNLANSMLSYVFFAKNKSMAESFKKMFDELQSGSPAVVVGSKLRQDLDGEPWNLLNNNVGANFIAPEIQNLMVEYERDFDSYIGLPNNEQKGKKERLIVDEVNANNQASASRAQLWLDCLKKSCDRVNAMFYPKGGGISVDWRVNPYESQREEVTLNE